MFWCRARILAAVGSVDYLIFSFLAYFVIERYGRRKVMMSSAAGCATCWIVISIAIGLQEHGTGDSFKLGALAVSGFFFFWAAFALGVLGVPVSPFAMVVEPKWWMKLRFCCISKFIFTEIIAEQYCSTSVSFENLQTTPSFPQPRMHFASPLEMQRDKG